MSKQRIKLGKQGEKIAAEFLVACGFTIKERNYRNKFGEIDIIACDEDIYVFIEVKTRSSSRFGFPEESVTLVKQRQISRVAQGYLLNKNIIDPAIRFDVVAIILRSDKPEINHIMSAFDAP